MLRWYRKAAQNGEQSALVGLFQAHLRGRGVRINVGEAAGYALATMRVGTIKDEDEEREVLRFVMRMDEKYEAAAEAACERIIKHEFSVNAR
jgi:TPR repeat protein